MAESRFLLSVGALSAPDGVLARGVREISHRRSHQATSRVQSPLDPDGEQGLRTGQQGERQLSRRDGSTGPQGGTERPCTWAGSAM